MSAPAYRTGVVACTKFASPALRRACVAHRISTLEKHTSAASSHGRNTRRFFATAVGNQPPSTFEQDHDRQRSLTVGEDAHQGRPSQTQKVVHASIKQLDPYLPLEGRSGTWLENLAAFEGVRNARSLPSVLREIDRNFEHGALVSLALDQGRWSAYLYLTDALIKVYATSRLSVNSGHGTESIWNQVELPPPEILTTPSRAEPYFKAIQPSDGDVNGIHPVRVPSTTHSKETEAPHSFHAAIGSVWQSLGHIILEASGLDREQSDRLMSHVHRVLSIMHSEDCMHPMIYHFDSDTVAEIRRKSPYLQSMSSRFMTVMSDSTWKAVEDRVIDSYTWMSTAYAEAEGLELKDLYPTVRNIGHEAWLDLVLWSCVLGGHGASGLSLIREAVSRKGEAHWRSIAWPDLLDENLRNSDTDNAGRIRSRFDKVAGAFEGYSNNPPILTLPSRTISSEVIVALIEMMPMACHASSHDDLARDIDSLKQLHSTSGHDLDFQFWRIVAMRVIDLTNVDPELQPSVLQSLYDAIALKSRSAPRKTSHRKVDRAEEEASRDDIYSSFHHRALAALVGLGDVNGALKTFLKLQQWADRKKQAALRSFFSTPLEITEDRSQHVVLSDIVESQEIYSSSIPASTLAPFLDLLTKYRLLELGSWLLESEDPDGAIISQKIRSSGVFLPALIRFGIAIKDYKIVEEVLGYVDEDKSLLSPDLLHTLFYALIEFKKIDNAESILRIMRDQKSEIVIAEDVMVLARYILRLETRDDSDTLAHMDTATRMLADILEYRYSRPMPEDRQAFVEQQNHIYQLHRIISGVGGRLSNLPINAREVGSFRHTSPVPVEAFNILLHGVVESKGPAAGKALVERWCVLSDGDRPLSQLYDDEDVPIIIDPEMATDRGLPLPTVIDPQGDNGGRVVEPNRYTIQLIMDAALAAPDREQRPATKRRSPAALTRPMISWEPDDPSGSGAGLSQDAILKWCRSALKSLGP